MNWFNGWSEIKKPTASNSFDNLSSNSQSFVFSIICVSFSSSSPNKSIWFAILLSKLFLDLVMILGIELNIDFLLLFKLSKAPALTKPSNWSLLISLGFILFIKSLIVLNFPLLILSLTILDIASVPTALIPPKP